MLDLNEVGAQPTLDAAGIWHVRMGIYLPDITPAKGYSLKVRVIHELDQFKRGIEPRDFDLAWQAGSQFDLWRATLDLPAPGAVPALGHFGQPGVYLYRYQLLRGGRVVTFWFADPFGRASGLGTLSAFTLDPVAAPFPWTDGGYRTPEVDQLVVYELHVGEFNHTFDGVVDQLDYLSDLGITAIELMPVTNVKEEVEWGYTPLGYFAPDDRFGGPNGFRRLVDACHARGIAVVLDAVYAHAHPEFAYNLVYNVTGEPNPMMGVFEGEFFPNRPGTDYRREFTRNFFFEVNRHWLAEYHLDGFRYDYVPGFYDGPLGQGYANLVFHTYQHSKSIPRFQAEGGRSRIIQCAEHLPDPRGILRQTYSNTAWQNELYDKVVMMAGGANVDASFGMLLDPELIGYPDEYSNSVTGDRFPVAPFQYVESHDHGRFLTRIAPARERDLLDQQFGDRDLFYKTQPYVIALYTAKGIPMLWHGQEFAENWNVPNFGLGRNSYERPLHWEFFYDPSGKALVRLYRILGALRRRYRALRSRGFYFYFNDTNHLRQGVIAFRREVLAEAGQPAEHFMVALNFTDRDADTWLQFPVAGHWVEQLDLADNPSPAVDVINAGNWHSVRVPSNYGCVYLQQ